MDPALNFCSACGHPLAQRIPAGDNLPRGVCDGCGAIHYRNPRLVAGAIPVWDGEILLCRRAIEPRRGYWTLPAGFMENGEALDEAAVRETGEEAGARIELGPLFALISVPEIHQVHAFHRARLLDLDFAPGDESLEVALFASDAIPWRELAFRTVSLCLERYLADAARGTFGLHEATLRRSTELPR